jgi:hypothetical protein
MSPLFRLSKLILSSATLLVALSAAHAAPLISGLGGPDGFGTLTQARNDDSSSNLLSLPFEVNFFGNRYNSLYVNNNGNVTFNGPVSTFTPQPFPISSQPMIAPFWGDVDTRCASCGSVYIGSPNANTTVVTWNNVGFYSNNSSLTNNFQLALRNQGGGNFDVEFRYDRLSWTTGDASGGSRGLGGTAAQAGYDAGNGTNFFTLPGSRTAAVLNLATGTNVTGGAPGFWSYAIREGALPGQTPLNPLLPVVVNGAFTFNFNVNIPAQRVFIDPVVAVGYDYVVRSGQKVTSVQFTSPLNDPNGYQILAADGTVLATGVMQNDIFTFANGGVTTFSVRGIEPSIALDPSNPTAFVTGLTFDCAPCTIDITQTPVTINTTPNPNPTNVPLPGTLVLLALGGVAMLRKRFI